MLVSSGLSVKAAVGWGVGWASWSSTPPFTGVGFGQADGDDKPQVPLSAAGKLGLFHVVTGFQLPERVHMNSSHTWNYTVIFFFFGNLLISFSIMSSCFTCSMYQNFLPF